MDDKEAELQRTYRELNAMNVTKDNEISSLRAELKMKSFEVTSLGATFEVLMPFRLAMVIVIRRGWHN